MRSSVRPLSRTLTAFGSIAILAFTALPSSAATDEGATEDVAELVSAVAPAVALAPTQQNSEAVQASAANATASIPVSPEGVITLKGSEDGLALEVSLPAEAVVGPANVAADGTVVYAASGDSPDVAVQMTSTGTVRVQTVIPSESAGLEYTYTFGEGVIPAIQEDGSVVLASDEANGVSVGYGTVAAPWAFDAAGEPVDTHYSVSGDQLVQVVTPAPDTTYPIVADPTVTVGTGIYVYYNKTETKNIAKSPVTDKLKYASIVCAVIPNGVAAAGCALYIYDSYSSVADTFWRAARSNMRVEMKYTFSGHLIGWKPVA